MTDRNNVAGARETLHKGMAAVISDKNWFLKTPDHLTSVAIRATRGSINVEAAKEEIVRMLADRGFAPAPPRLVTLDGEDVSGSGQPDRTDLQNEIIDVLLSRPAKDFAAITVDTIRHATGKLWIDQEQVIEALTDLASENEPIIRTVYGIGDIVSGEELDDESVKEWKETGILVHPTSGEIIANPDDAVWVEWSALEASRDIRAHRVRRQITGLAKKCDLNSRVSSGEEAFVWSGFAERLREARSALGDYEAGTEPVSSLIEHLGIAQGIAGRNGEIGNDDERNAWAGITAGIGKVLVIAAGFSEDEPSPEESPGF